MVDIDRITIERAAKGDDKAFRRLYDHYAPFVWRIVYRMVNGDRAASEEIVQETFVHIHRSFKKYAFESTLGTWIYRIAFNAAKDYLSRMLRHREVTVPYDDDRPNFFRATDIYETRELVQKILDSLQPEERFLLVAREVDGLTFEEIAAISGKSSESLRTRMSRLKDRIKETFGKEPVLEEAVV